MKKLVVFAGCFLLSFLAHSQEADNHGRAAEITLIPRLDINPIFTPGSSKPEVTLGNSSFYSLFEGNLTENLSFSISNHWLSDDPKMLYNNTLRSDDVNWFDWAYLSYSLGDFTFTAGKDMMTTGGFEIDDYDFDVYPSLQTSFWNALQVYQWGGKLEYTLKEKSTFSFQITTSPFGERPFTSKLFNYSLGYRGDYGFLRTNWSATAMQAEPGKYFFLFSLGQEADAGDFTFRLDYNNMAGGLVTEEGENPYYGIFKGHTLSGQVLYTLPDEKLELLAKGAFERVNEIGDNYIAGCAVQYYPLKDNKSLRLHTALAYRSFEKTLSLTFGAMYYLNLTVF